MTKWQLLAAALVLVAISGWIFLLSRRRRSVLLHPEALRLERGDPTHLVGRADDIEQLIRLCREQPLVFLEGESGCGKSALLQAGLIPALKSNPQLLPIYVESLVGFDWERDPRRFLAAALWSALDEPARAALELKTVPGADAIRGIIEAVQTKLGRIPLVILDQFDDYQNRHRGRFLSRKTWLKPARLAGQNGFWRDVRDLLAGNTIHLVVVTRTDTAAGLTSVRFIEAETYRLDSLNAHFVGPLLAELAKQKDGQEVIGDPEFGWTTLQSRLTEDLEHAGTILQVEGIFHLLRHPLSAGETTEELLALLEQIPGVDAKFDGDLWKAVNWVQAEQQRGRLRVSTSMLRSRPPKKHIARLV